MNKIELLQKVKKIQDSFGNFVSNKREIKCIHGQVVGCESYRLDFIGHQEGEVNDAILDLMIYLENEGK